MTTLTNTSVSGDGSWLLTALSFQDTPTFSFLLSNASLTVNDAFWVAGGGATLTGTVIAGTAVKSQPSAIKIGTGDLTISATVNVVGALVLQGGSGPQNTTPEILESGAINVGPTGTLTLQNNVFDNFPINVAGGTVDLTTASSMPQINFTGGSGNVLLRQGVGLDVTGFRAGDTITVEGTSVSGALWANGSGYYQVGTTQLEFAGPTAPAASYTATADGHGNTIVTTTAEPSGTVSYTDLALGVSSSAALATGASTSTPWEYVDNSNDSEALSTATPDVSILSIGGTKAVEVYSGQNVISPGYGSSFLTGGTGDDTFRVSLELNAPAVWDTICNFHANDTVTVSGLIPGAFTTKVDAWDGAAGYQGATIRFLDNTGTIMGSLTFAGQSAAQVEAHAQGIVGTGYQITG